MDYGLPQRDIIIRFCGKKNGYRKANILEAFKEEDALISLVENPFAEIIK